MPQVHPREGMTPIDRIRRLEELVDRMEVDQMQMDERLREISSLPPESTSIQSIIDVDKANANPGGFEPTT